MACYVRYVICVIGMIDFVILVNLLHSCIKVPFLEKKKDVIADMVIAVKQNETKSQEKKGRKQQLNQTWTKSATCIQDFIMTHCFAGQATIWVPAILWDGTLGWDV